MQDYSESPSSFANQIDKVMYFIEFQNRGVPHVHLVYEVIDHSNISEESERDKETKSKGLKDSQRDIEYWMIGCWMHSKRKVETSLGLNNNYPFFWRDKEKGEQHNLLYNSDEGRCYNETIGMGEHTIGKGFGYSEDLCQERELSKWMKLWTHQGFK